MELRHLEYFVAVAEEGSVTGAAQRLRVAQPSLSHQVRALELELGGELLERLPRGVRLTAGRPHAGRHGTTARRQRPRADACARQHRSGVPP